MKAQLRIEVSLFLVLVFAMVLVAFEVHFAFSLFTGLCLLWRLLAERGYGSFLSKRLTGFLSLVALAMTLLFYRTLVGQEPAYSFLLMLTGLKILDFETERDKKILILLGFILVAVKALFTIDIYWIGPMVFCFFALWYHLLPQKLAKKWKYLFTLILMSMPLALALFVFFPRVVLPWALNQANLQGEIGFSEGLNPGSISGLVERNQLVLQATFKNNPKPLDLYWRGGVLYESLGLRWQAEGWRGATPHAAEELAPSDYEVVQFAIETPYLFVLDDTEKVKAEGLLIFSNPSRSFRARSALRREFKFNAQKMNEKSDLVSVNQELLERALQLPPLTPKIETFLQNITQENLSEQAKIKKLDLFFASGDFVYTLNPGVYRDNQLEDFLFERKKGFCEHFSAAYAILARGLGIPARVVTGFHGGVYNTYGNFWTVNQRDAHAWVEVFVDNEWRRKDPTQLVAPLRFEIGAEDFFGLSEEDQVRFAKLNRLEIGNESIFSFLATYFDHLNYRWTLFLLEYDRNTQRSFISQNLTRILGIGLCLVLAVILVLRSSRMKFWNQDRELQELLDLINRVCSRHNLDQERAPHARVRQLNELGILTEGEKKLIDRGMDDKLYLKSRSSEFEQIRKILKDKLN